MKHQNLLPLKDINFIQHIANLKLCTGSVSGGEAVARACQESNNAQGLQHQWKTVSFGCPATFADAAVLEGK